MNLRVWLKEQVGKMPPGLSRPLVWVPFSWRLGRSYGHHRTLAVQLDAASEEELRGFTFSRLKKMVDFAWTEVPFYRGRLRGK